MNHHNTSRYAVTSTATTNQDCIDQRIQNIKRAFPSSLKIIETCAGISSVFLKESYREAGFHITTNDIDPRYQRYEKDMVIGDVLSLDFSSYDVVVFAPPLSRGCSGNREDSLMIEEVRPSYREFLANTIFLENLQGICLVLPGRTFSTARDKEQFYSLVSCIYNLFSSHQPNGQAFEKKLVVKRCTKYVDLYLRFNND